MNLVLSPMLALEKLGLIHVRLESEKHGNSPVIFSTESGKNFLRYAVSQNWISFVDAAFLKTAIDGIDFSANGDNPRIVILKAIKESEIAELIELVAPNFFDELKVEEPCSSCGKVHSKLSKNLLDIFNDLIVAKLTNAR